MSERKTIDLEFLNDIVEGDKRFESELFILFKENAKRNITKMEASIESENNNDWYMASHAFKGASGSIGAFPLSKMLENAQNNSERDKDGKKLMLEKITKEYLEVQKSIKALGY